MKKARITTLFGLIALTIVVAVLSLFFPFSKIVLLFILLLSGTKFMLVVFQFMDMRKANPFWKVLISIYLAIFLVIVFVAA